MEVMDAAFWARRSGFTNVAERLDWAAKRLTEELFPNHPSSSSGRTSAFEAENPGSMPGEGTT